MWDGINCAVVDDNLNFLRVFDAVGKGMDNNDELKTVDIVVVDETPVLVSFTRVVNVTTLITYVGLLMLVDDLNIIDGDEDEVMTERGVLGIINDCDSEIKETIDVKGMMDDFNWKNDETERGVIEIKGVIDDCDSKDVISEVVTMCDLLNVIDTTGEGVMMDEFDRGDGVLKTESWILVFINLSDMINEEIIIDDSKRDMEGDELKINVVEMINVFDSLIEDMPYDIT